MSGGVDSSVAALLLKQQGHQVAGVFMKNWEEDDTDTFCPASQDMADAQAVCDQLGIELIRINFAEEYWQRVFTHFLAEYQAGRTPNPDILCNKEIKFKAFLDFATQRGADCIATGHYAISRKNNDLMQLEKALDTQKDQSYFLYALDQSQLAHSMFPLGQLTKPAIRHIAKQAGFKNHAKKDSTGICFIGERRFKPFLQDFLPAQPGHIETLAGTIVGQHDGLMFYTHGQRQGLKIGGLKNTLDAPWYVVGKNFSRNILLVAQGPDHPALFSQTLYAQEVHWNQGAPPTLPFECQAKTRYRQADQSCIITPSTKGQYKIDFALPQRAVAPGQSIVFYQGTICLGGGIIKEYTA